MTEKEKFTLKCTMLRQRGSYRFIFFCDLCDASYTTSLIDAQTQKQALELAQQEARRHFNLCHFCRRWICDMHYNEDEMMCVQCAPKTYEKTKNM